MWHFINVLQGVLFERGEKQAEEIRVEKTRIKELESMRADLIRSIIDKKLKVFVREKSTLTLH